MRLKTIDDFEIKGRNVLVRVDVNAAVDNGKVLDAPRFIESAKTIAELMNKKARVAVIAHQGRKGDSDFLPLVQHAEILTKHIGRKIEYVDYLFEDEARKKIEEMKDGEAILLKNVREYDDEKDVENKKNRYAEFCKLFDLYVNDAFSVSHREQGSIVIPPKYIKSCIGRSFEREINALKSFRLSKKKKGVFLIGGAKIEDYFPIFNVLENKRNVVIASGVLANLILVVKGCNLGYEKKWLEEKKFTELIPKIKEIIARYEEQIILPVDFAFGNKKRKERKIADAPFDEKILDVGIESVNIFKKYIKNAENIFMKGPLGFSEIKEFSYATVEILKAISARSEVKGVISVLGGGHLTTTIKEYKIKNNFTHISTSGGALIAYISGQKMPGIEALERKNAY